MMRFLLSYWIQIAAYFLAVCTLYSEQRQRERRWDDDIGMPLDPPPPWLKDEIHEENEELEELFFYKRSYAQFIEGMKERKLINHPKVEELFYRVRRADFINVKPRYGFADMPYSFDNQVTMEFPSYISLCLEQFVDHLHNNSRVLDLGSGQGYMSTCLAHLVSPHGKVYALEHDPCTLNSSLRNIRINSPELLHNKTLEVILKDARWGHAEGGPYDAIFFGGAVTEVSNTILSQLKPNGRIVAPIGTPWRQNLTVIDKRPDGSITSRILKRVTADFLISLTFQLHPGEFMKPSNMSDEREYTKWWPPPPGVRPREHTFPLNSQSEEETTIPGAPTTKFEYLPESVDDRYVFDQDVLDVIYGPNKTISKRKKAKIMWERI